MESNNARGKRFYITITALVLVALFGGWFVHVLFNPNAGWRDVEFETTVNRFSSNIMQARVEWMRRGQPTDVFLSLAELNPEAEKQIVAKGRLRVLMSREGWPKARATGAAGCLELWALLGNPRQLRRDITVTYESSRLHPRCRFFYAEKEAFQFYPDSGQVEKMY